MEWKTIFHTNSILDFAHGIYRQIYACGDKNIWECLAANHLGQINRVIRLCTLRKQCRHWIIRSQRCSLQFTATVMLTGLIFILRMTICQVTKLFHRKQRFVFTFLSSIELDSLLFFCFAFKLFWHTVFLKSFLQFSYAKFYSWCD